MFKLSIFGDCCWKKKIEQGRLGRFHLPRKKNRELYVLNSNKSKKYIKNWRPISLLNVTYKIASGCIASRIKTVLPTIIDLDQSGFMSNRFTGDNIRLMYDTLKFSMEQKKTSTSDRF